MSLRENVKKLVVEHSRLVNENEEMLGHIAKAGDAAAHYVGGKLQTLAGHAGTLLQKTSALGGGPGTVAHGAGRVAVGGAAALGAKKLLGSAKQKVAGMAGG